MIAKPYPQIFAVPPPEGSKYEFVAALAEKPSKPTEAAKANYRRLVDDMAAGTVRGNYTADEIVSIYTAAGAHTRRFNRSCRHFPFRSIDPTKRGRGTMTNAIEDLLSREQQQNEQRERDFDQLVRAIALGETHSADDLAGRLAAMGRTAKELAARVEARRFCNERLATIAKYKDLESCAPQARAAIQAIEAGLANDIAELKRAQSRLRTIITLFWRKSRILAPKSNRPVPNCSPVGSTARLLPSMTPRQRRLSGSSHQSFPRRRTPKRNDSKASWPMRFGQRTRPTKRC